jgi:VWFA-related protein
VRLTSAFILAAVVAVEPVAPRVPAPLTVRTVYVTVTSANGAPVPDLTAADFSVAEGGTGRPVETAVPATARMHLTVMVEERLADASVRMGLFEFMKRLLPVAETGVIAIGHRTTTLVDYTTDLDALAVGLNKLSFVPQAQSNFTEGLLDVTQRIERQRPERPVIVVVTRASNRDGGASAKDVLDHLRQSGAMLYAVAIVDAPRTSEPLPTVSGTDDRLLAEPSRREDVLEGGTKQSGGRALEVTPTAGVPKALQQIAAELRSQYVIQYSLPDGVTPDRRLSVRLKRTGLSLRAPTLLPDR